jgi:hypothetical protein
MKVVPDRQCPMTKIISEGLIATFCEEYTMHSIRDSQAPENLFCKFSAGEIDWSAYILKMFRQAFVLKLILCILL